MLDSVTPTTPPQVPTAADLAAPTAKTAKDPSQLGKDDFLKLLVAQLKYQDPMKPADSTQFMAQTAQFSMLEQLTNMAKQSDVVLASQQSQTATGLIGRSITYTDSTTKEVLTGTVTGALFGGTDGPKLKVGDKEVPLSAITEVAAAPATPPAPPAAT